MSGGWQDEDVDGWKDGERMGRWMIGWMHRGVGRWMDECMDIAFWGHLCGQDGGTGARPDQHPRPLAADVDF